MKTVGIDIGGTHADGVLLAGGQPLVKKKVPVDHERLEATIITLLAELLAGEVAAEIGRIHLSSTLCTNAVICNRLDPVAMLIQAGPGMNPDFLLCGEHAVFLDGAVDHRGHVVKRPDDELVDDALCRFQQAGISSLGIVTKFSHRNPEVEQELAVRAEEKGFVNITLGHTLSGLPNFPRRVYTTWLNAGLKAQFLRFEQAVRAGMARLGLRASLSVLKADGGTMPLERAVAVPCESVLSGPAASVMGALALAPRSGDCIVVDIGGTTTDIALFIDGQPLLEPYGVTVMGRPTLIRALNSRSVGLGGDSRIRMIDQEFCIGPERLGVPAAFTDCEITGATPTDAMVVLGRLDGDATRAAAALALLCPGLAAEECARRVLTAFAAAVQQAVVAMIDAVFARPVYTVSALLQRRRLVAAEIVAVGGPAAALRQELAAVFNLPCTVPEHYEVANAIGAARARPTLSASLYADSAAGTMAIAEIGLRRQIGRSFTMADAEEALLAAMRQLASTAGYRQQALPPVDFVEREELNTVRGFSAMGKIIALKAQIRPGLECMEEMS